MKSLPFVILTLLASLHVHAQNPDSDATFDEARQEALEFNKTVTDEEMVEFFELIFKYHPENIAGFRSQSPEERKAFLAMYRQIANDVGVKISTLRGMDEDQLREMDELAKNDAEQAMLSAEALNRLHSYSTEEYRSILDEAVKLIGKFDSAATHALSRQTLFEDFPDGLAFIRPDLIHVGEDWCVIYLHKAIGRGIGYRIDQDDSGEWTIAWFNEYAAWENTPIDLRDPSGR